VGILLVALGHNHIAAHDKATLWKLIFSFHLPLFLFLSGVTLNAKSPRAAILPRIHALLKPAAFIGLLIFAKDILLHRDAFESLKNVLFATGPTLPSDQPIWYLPHLFLAVSFTAFIVNIFNFTKLQYFFVCLALLVTSRITAVSPQGLPWSIDLLPFSVACLLAGYSLRMMVLTINPKLIHALIISAVFLTAQIFTGEFLDLNSRIMPSIIGILLLCLGTAATISVTKILPEQLRTFFAYFGKASLFILLVHQPIDAIVSNLVLRHVEIKSIAAALGLLAGISVGLAIYEGTKRYSLIAALFASNRK